MYIFINFLSFLRIFVGIIIFLCLSFSYISSFLIILFFIGGISDYFDGYFARKYNMTSIFGEIIDPLSDKAMVIFILFGISIYLSSYYIGFLSAMIIFREIWVSSLRDFASRNSISNATKVIYIAKLKTAIQIITIFLYLIGIILYNGLITLVADIMLLITFTITMYSGAIYSLQTLKSYEKNN